MRIALLFTIAVSILCRICPAAPASQPASAPATGLYSVRDYGAAADGKTDDTAALQRAIDAATETGGIVELPPGKYLIAGSIKVKKGVAVRGVQLAPQGLDFLHGTLILATGGRDHEDAPPLFHLGDSAAVMGITIWYPKQKTDDIHAYPWTFQLEGQDNTVENVTIINSYNGLRTGPALNVRHRVRSLYACTLRRGIFVDNCWDIGRIENCQLHCHWWTKPEFGGGNRDAVYKYMVENLEAYIFARTDWEYATNNFVFPAKIGWRFIKTEHGACNGHFTADGADACETAVLVEQIQPMGLLFTGGQFVAFNGQDPVEVRIAKTCAGSVRFVNCAFWGPALHNAVLEGDGWTSFSDCFFSNWKKGSRSPLVVARGGKLQISNSTFATSQPSVLLEKGVRHAIVQGNNGRQGVTIIDQTAGRAILANNEPPASTQPAN